jgi:hypothetical protein
MNEAYCGEFKTSVANLNVTLFYSRDRCIASCSRQLLVADDLNTLICIHGIAHGYHQLDTFAFKNAFASTLAYSSSVNACQSTKQVNVIISNGSYMCYMHGLFYISAAYKCLDSKIAKSTMLRTITGFSLYP